MEVTIKLNANEMLHSIRTGAMESFIDNVNATEKAVSDIAMSTKPDTEKEEKITEKAEKVTKKPEKEEKTVENEQKEPENTQSDEEVITLEMLRAKFSKLIKAGKKAEVQEILGEFDVAKITDLPGSAYAEAMAKAEAL